MKSFGPFVALALLAAAPPAVAVSGVPESMDPAQVPAYRLVRPDLATGGRPSPEAVSRLRAMGFKTVIDLRTEGEGVAAERTAVEAQGLRFVHVPITPETFSLANVEAVEKVLADPAAGPVFLHCASSNRVGAVWAAIQARKGRSEQEALAAGKAAGLHSASMTAAFRRVVGLAAEPPAGPAGPLPVPPAAPVKP